MSGTYTHRPVLLEECIQGLAIRPDGLYIDGTLGRGGHSEEIVEAPDPRRAPHLHRPGQPGHRSGARPAWPPGPSRSRFLHGNFGDLSRSYWTMPASRKRMGCSLTWASPPPSWTTPERGFSYMHDAPLDMRMDRDDALTACDGGEPLAPGGAAAHPV